VYQEDYPSLLYATETGRKITYTPSNIVELIQPFSQYVMSAVDEVSDWILSGTFRNPLTCVICTYIG